MLNKVLTLIPILSMTTMLVFLWANIAIENGYPTFIIHGIAFLIGFFVPRFLIKWLSDKQDTEV